MTLVVSTVIATKHVNSRCFHLLFLRLRFSCGFIAASAAATSSTAARSSELAGVLEVLLVRLSLVEGVVVESNGDGKDDLEGVRDGVRHGRLSGMSNGEGQGGEGLERLGEFGGKDIIGDVENLGVEEAAVVVDGLELETICEGGDLELLEESSLRGSNLVTLVDELDVVDDLNLTTGNLGCDLKGLEEGSLTRITTRGSLGNDHIARCNCPYTGRSGTNVLLEDLTDLSKVAVGEDEADISAKDLDQSLLGGFGVLLNVLLEDLAHHRVFSHKDFALAAEALARLLKLVGSNIVNLDDKALGVSAEELLHAVEILGLAFGGERHA
mmetsp:Transcript_11008/g.23844  ORF Transcript_11008/g.23844 Transcript_11008/m.23844 type:complete len:326 (+) Transcript_11008:110-1087(+)